MLSEIVPVCCQVFLDGKQVVSSTVPYPRYMTESLARCNIGWDFDGQMSGVLLFSRAADLENVEAMLKGLAVNTKSHDEKVGGYKVSTADPDPWVDSTAVPDQDHFDANIRSPRGVLVAALMPNRTMNNLCLEPHNKFHTRLRNGKTHAWTMRTAQDVIRSIGGTPLLLPLACDLLTDSTLSCSSGSVSSSYMGESVDTVVSLVHSFLLGKANNQVRINRLCFTTSVYNAVLVLAGVRSWTDN